ncbi:MAG: DUF2142 domain-containing protein [Microcella sp.]
MIARLRRIPLIAWAPVLAFLTLTAWSFASPIGAGPDDDFHLVSSWCAGPTADRTCLPTESPREREVPAALDDIDCFAYDATRSAACQGDDWSWSVDELVVSERGNFIGAYPPVFYAVMGALSGDDIQLAALAMRLLTVVLFTGLLVALWMLLPEVLRGPLAWGWLITTVPLGVFLLGTNNPSAWAMIGVATSWLALLGWFQTPWATDRRRKLALGSLFVVTVLMAAGSRGDAALYAGFGMALVLVLTVPSRGGAWRPWLRDAVLPVVMGIVALVFFLSARQSQSGLGGFGGGTGAPGSLTGGAAGGATDPEAALTGFGLFAYNLLNVPFLWTGALGDWALGWLDTSMPAIVSAAAVAAFVVVGFAGIGRLWGRKAIVLAALVLVLIALPVYVLQAGGDVVGEQVQPRYILPLIIMLGGMLALTRTPRELTFTRAQRFALVAALAGAHFVALHLNIRRYVTGIDASGVNLDAGAEWWWAGPVGPTAVWLLGSLAYALLVWIVVRTLGRRTAQTPGMPITR